MNERLQLRGKIQVERFDAEKMVRALRAKLSTDGTEDRHFNWTLLGRECGICFNAAPSGVRFLAGSVDMEGEKIVRKARAKEKANRPEEAAEVRPEVMDKEASRGDADALSAAEKVMKDLEKLLKKRAKQELQKKADANPDPDNDTKRRLDQHGTELDGAKFLMNPKSFTQSVENIFNFSFLVKKGKASVRAPTDPNKLKLVQLNNEKPPKKSKPAATKLLQVDSNVVVGTDSSASAKLNSEQGSRLDGMIQQYQD